MLGRLLQTHPDIEMTIEDPEIFPLVCDITIRGKNEYFPKLVEIYRTRSRDHLIWGDKSHPNIWIAEDLDAVFDNAYFIGIERSVQSVVASSLSHEGVLSWHKIWRDLPIPNHFLGITPENVGYYGAMVPEERIALRWLSHHRKMEELATKLRRFVMLGYEDLLESPADGTRDLSDFLSIDNLFDYSMVDFSPKHRWRELSWDQMEMINRIISPFGSS